jgi:hypothetical protein
MTDTAMPEDDALLRRTYAAFNARDIDAVLAAMHPDVDWPNLIDGVRARGHDAVRDYWSRQFAVIDPHVEPVRITAQPDGRVAVDVHQVVRDRDGAVLVDQTVRHTYVIRDGLVARMDVSEI